MGRVHSYKKYQQPLYPTDLEGNEIETSAPNTYFYDKKEDNQFTEDRTLKSLINSEEGTKVADNYNKRKEDFAREFGNINLGSVNTTSVNKPETRIPLEGTPGIDYPIGQGVRTTDGPKYQFSDGSFMNALEREENVDKHTREAGSKAILGTLGILAAPLAAYGVSAATPSFLAGTEAIGNSIMGSPVSQALGEGMSMSRMGVPGLSVNNFLHSGFISHGIMSLPKTLEAWGNVDSVDAFYNALDKTFWNTIDFLGVPSLIKSSGAGPKVMNEIMNVKRIMREELIGKTVTKLDGSVSSGGGLYMGDHKKFVMGILPRMENKIRSVIAKHFGAPNPTIPGNLMKSDSGISHIHTDVPTFNKALKEYKPNYITTTTGETINITKNGGTMGTHYVDQFMLDSYRFPEQTKQIITNSNRIIKEAGGLKNMTTDQLARDPKALLGLFLKNRKQDYVSLQSGYFNKGIAFTEIGGKEYILIRRVGNKKGGYMEDAISLRNLSLEDKLVAKTMHVTQVSEVGTYVKGSKVKPPAKELSGWGGTLDGLGMNPYVRSTKNNKYEVFDNTANNHLYIEMQPKLQGKSIAEMNIDDLSNISPENISQLLKTISTSKKAGIKLDVINPNNYLFNPSTGNVGFVDLAVQSNQIFKNGRPMSMQRQDYVYEARSIVSTMYKSMLDDLAKNASIFTKKESAHIIEGVIEGEGLVSTINRMKITLQGNSDKIKILNKFNKLTRALTTGIKQELKLLGVSPLLVPLIIGEESASKNGNEQQ